MIITQEEEKQKETNDPSSCPGEVTHRWRDDYQLYDVCYCCFWQIIEIVSENKIVCMNIHGRIQIFDKNK